MAALLFGSGAFVVNVSVAAHELGHLTLDRLKGVEATVVLEPFRSSYVILNQPWPADMPTWPVVAGPLANLAVGVFLFAALWRWRNPYLLPLLMWGPIALIQEPTTALVQVFTGEAGTDWVLISEAGTGTGLIVALAVVGLLAGVAGLLAVLPTAGVQPGENLATRLGVLSIGMGGFTLLAVGASVALGYPTAEVSRALGQSVSSLLLAVLLAVLYPAFQRFHRAEVDGVPIQAIWVVIGVSGALVVLFMLV